MQVLVKALDGADAMRLALCIFAALLVPASAAAEIFKCEKGGGTIYQQQPCPRDERQSPIHIEGDPSPGWEGCYEGEVGTYSRSREPTSLRVRRSARGLVLEMDGQPETLPVREMTAAERADLARSMNDKGGSARVLGGFGVPAPRDHDDPSKGDSLIMFVARVQGEGRDFLMFVAPFTAGSVYKAPCARR